jgi:AraC-like DNA-binding protein
MINKVITPPDILKNHVINFWVLEFDAGLTSKRLNYFAWCCPRLTFQCLDGYPNIRNENGTFLPTTFLSGPSTIPFNFQLSGRYSHVAATFYPHALKSVFNIAPVELVNGFFDANNFCPPTVIYKLLEARTYEEKVQILAVYIAKRIELNRYNDDVINDCIHGNHSCKEWSVRQIVERHKIGERQLERKFADAIGISPKTYLRIVRLQKALECMQTTEFVKLSSIAMKLGYTDHPHFTRDFKVSTGLTPSEYLATRKKIEYGSSFLDE